MRVSSTWVLMAISQTSWLSWQEIVYQRTSVKIKDILTHQIPALLEKQVIQPYPLYLCLHCTSSCLSALCNLWAEMRGFFILCPRTRTVGKIGVLVFQMGFSLIFFLRICAYPVLLYDAGEGGRNHLHLRVEDSWDLWEHHVPEGVPFLSWPWKKLFCTDEIHPYFRDFHCAKRNETVCPDLQPRPWVNI